MHYTGRANRGAILRAVVCAEEGMTGFGDLVGAYDSLDEPTKALIANLGVIRPAEQATGQGCRSESRRGCQPQPALEV